MYYDDPEVSLVAILISLPKLFISFGRSSFSFPGKPRSRAFDKYRTSQIDYVRNSPRGLLILADIRALFYFAWLTIGEAPRRQGMTFKMSLGAHRGSFCTTEFPFYSREIESPDITYTDVLFGNRIFSLLSLDLFFFSLLVNEM